MPEALPHVYRSHEVEKKWYSFWERGGYFRPEHSPKGKPYTIVIPPPNVTGILHMGHALNNTLQDILARFRRMQGRSVLWLAGTDHAGIATQNVVERALVKEGKKRQELGREAFIQRVWKWKEEHGTTIVRQLRDLGASLDWSRERFTMDEGLSHSVQQVFLKLHKEELIYRGVYLVNWCPRCQTALSDEESEHREVRGRLWHIKYPLKQQDTTDDGRRTTDEKEFLVVATTRPETLLGDTACAIHPKDKRNAHLLKKTAVLPILKRELPIIADNAVDPEFGTGVVKVTPAHDPNDFAMGQRHGLTAVNILNPDGTLNENAGPYRGMDRFQARAEIVSRLEAEGLLLKTEEHTHAVGHCYRCHTVVEPYLTDQWFVRLRPLAQEALKLKGLKFTPDRWTKVYVNWMKNARDWCISRQIWWGHRIPAWYCDKCYGKARSAFFSKPLDFTRGMEEKTSGICVTRDKPRQCPTCRGSVLRQDEDVLDTWFSSWLWPFSTLGWPEKTQDLKRHYPTDDLVTAPEIIFFWVARMVMAGVYFLDELPFSNVVIHGTVRDDTGRKMSKSLGNVIDPLNIVEEVGADALRFSLVMLTGTGQDLLLSREKFDVGRNFTNKIWNAARFILMNANREAGSGKREAKPDSRSTIHEPRTTNGLALPERWILSRLSHAVAGVTASLERFRFDEAAGQLYEFFWHEFCDWYVEMAKPRVGVDEVQNVLLRCLDESLRLLHPFMPFITEEIWQKLPHDGESVMVSAWPRAEKKRIDREAEDKMNSLLSAITAARNIRSEWNIPQGAQTRTAFVITRQGLKEVFQEHAELIRRLAKVGDLTVADHDIPSPGSVTAVQDFGLVRTELGGLVDLEKERRRLEAEFEETQFIAKKLKERLGNEDFLSRAPQEVVEKERSRLKELEDKEKRFATHLKALGR